MPTYPVNPADPTSPTDQQGAKQGAEEFRALKALIASMIVASSASAGPRQVIQSAVLDANGYNNALTVGAGLRPGLTASAVDPLHLSIANGFTGGKAINSDESIIVNIADILGADLPASNTSYLYRNYGTDYNATLIPPQYGYAFDRTKGALLNFEAANASIIMNDDFGNTWTPQANAQISTAQFKFGTSSLLLDGTLDRVTSSNFVTMGDSSWEACAWFRFNALPGVGITQYMMSATNTATFGWLVGLVDVAGVKKLNVWLSSDGTTWNLASSSVGTNTVWATNTWYRVRFVFDALAGTYRIYLSIAGAIESQDFSLASTARICAVTEFCIGGQGNSAATTFNGWIDAFRFVSCATKTTIENPAIVAPIITDYKYPYFSIPKMQMFEVTAASAGAGVNPTLTSVLRLFLGEADTSGAAITAVRNYAVRGEYQSPLGIVPGTSSFASVNHNLGFKAKDIALIFVCITSEQGYVPGDELTNLAGTNASYALPHPITANKIAVSFATDLNNSLVTTAKTGGDSLGLVAAKWNYKFIVKRGW